MRMPTLALAAILTLPSAARAADAPSGDAAQVKSLIETAVNNTIEVLKDKKNDRDARRQKIFAIIDPVVDFSLMGKLTLGRTHWTEFSEPQRQEFVQSFSRVIRDSVFDKIEVYSNETAEFENPTPSDKGKYSLLMNVIAKGTRYKALFKLYRKEDAWKVYDLEIEGISMVRIYSAQYDQVLAKGTPADLLSKLKTKALATPDDFKIVAKPKADRKQ